MSGGSPVQWCPISRGFHVQGAWFVEWGLMSEGGELYSEVQCMSNGHMGPLPPCGQTDRHD